MLYSISQSKNINLFHSHFSCRACDRMHWDIQSTKFAHPISSYKHWASTKRYRLMSFVQFHTQIRKGASNKHLPLTSAPPQNTLLIKKITIIPL